MPILAVGTDIIEIARFRDDRLSPRFLQTVFTEAERAYCDANPRPEQHRAVRFAAKEAAAKALEAVVGFVSVCQVEVLRGARGAPSIALMRGRHGEEPPILPVGARLHVSLSHSDHYATAVVVVDQP